MVEYSPTLGVVQHENEIDMRMGGIAPSVIREFSGIYPTFASAFKELISNAFDADATQVSIDISPDLSTIVIKDNGVGMTPFDFQNDYLRIGGTTQHRNGNTTDNGRQPIGRKGIGFLAIARYCHSIQLHTHAARTHILSKKVIFDPKNSRLGTRHGLLDNSFSFALAPHVTIRSVRSAEAELKQSDYVQRIAVLDINPETWQKLRGREITIEYDVDCRAVDLIASIDYDYLMSLDWKQNLETLEDFCRIQIVAHDDVEDTSFTQITLHLKEFVRKELMTPKRRGHVRNIASKSGLDQFLWDLSRSAPIAYDASLDEFETHGMEDFNVPHTSIPFSVILTDSQNHTHELRRPFFSELRDYLGSAVRQPVSVDFDELEAKGYIIGFSEPVFPAELRGITIRVRGVEIGKPSFMGIEGNLPKKYRSFLSHIVGEINVIRGLDAATSIVPGRAGFYGENAHFHALRQYLIGDGEARQGILGKVLKELWKQNSVESAATRIVQDAKRRREAFLEISQALTSLSIGSRYGRALRKLFSRSNIVAGGLGKAPEYQIQIPTSLGGYTLEFADIEGTHKVDTLNEVVRLNRNSDVWNNSLFILGRNFDISLRNAGPDDPLCEIDFTTNQIYLNWMHPTRSKMGDVLFVKSALSWRTAYLASDGDIDQMMNMAHRLISYAV